MTKATFERWMGRHLPLVFVGFVLVVPACSDESVARAPIGVGQSGSAAPGCIDQPGKVEATLSEWYREDGLATGLAALLYEGTPLATPSQQLARTIVLLEERLAGFSVQSSTESVVSPGGCIIRRDVTLGAADGSVVTVKIWQLTNPMNPNTIPQSVAYVMTPPDLLISSLDQSGEETGIRIVIKVLRDGTSVRVFALCTQRVGYQRMADDSAPPDIPIGRSERAPATETIHF